MSRPVGEGGSGERFAVVHRRGLMRAMGAVVIALPVFVFSIVQGALNLREALLVSAEEVVPVLETPAETVARPTLRPVRDLVGNSFLPPCHRQPLCFLATDPP